MSHKIQMRVFENSLYGTVKDLAYPVIVCDHCDKVIFPS